FLHHFLNRHRYPTATLALVGSFHEGEQFDRRLRADGWLTGAEKAADLLAEMLVAAPLLGHNDAFAAEGDRTGVGFVLANAAIGAHPSAGPGPRNEIGVVRLDSGDRFAA